MDGSWSSWVTTDWAKFEYFKKIYFEIWFTLNNNYFIVGLPFQIISSFIFHYRIEMKVCKHSGLFLTIWMFDGPACSVGTVSLSPCSVISERPVSPMMLAMCESKGERRSAVLCPPPVAQISWLWAVFCLSRCSQCHHYWLLVCIKEQTAGNVCNSVILTISQMNILIGTSSGNAPMRVLMDADVSEDHPLVVKRPNQPNVWLVFTVWLHWVYNRYKQTNHI